MVRLLVVGSLTAAITMAVLLLLFPRHAHATMINDRTNEIISFVEAHNLDVPDTIDVGLYPDDQFNGIAIATANPFGIALRESYFFDAEARFYNENKKRLIKDATQTYVLLHEVLHYVQGVRYVETNPDDFLDSYRFLEEGVVDAVSQDLIKQFIISRFGLKAYRAYLDNGSLQIAAYHDNVQYVRLLSQKATGSISWKSKKAREWRAWLLTVPLPQRQEIVNSVYYG